MSHLMYSSKDDVLVNRSEIAMMETPPARGRFHKPYPFSTFVEDVASKLNDKGIDIIREEYAVRKDENRLFGMMELGQLGNKDYTVTLGLRGSHDQSIPRGIALGTHVMVCSNLCFHGNLGNFKTRQTTHMDERIHEIITRAIDTIPLMAERQQDVFDAYKNFQIDKIWKGDAVLVELFRRGAFNSGQLGKAIQEWSKPSYDEHGQYGNTAWKLFNACTEALKPTGSRANMNTIQTKSNQVSDYFNEKIVQIAA